MPRKSGFSVLQMEGKRCSALGFLEGGREGGAGEGFNLMTVVLVGYSMGGSKGRLN